MRKALYIIIICLLTIYAPIELSRMILCYSTSISFIFEVTFIWVFYLFAIFILYEVIDA